MTQKVINFISNLPHFHHDEIDGKFVATRLTDGTVYLAPDEPEAQEQGLIVIWWQGKSDNQTIACGAQIVKMEIIEAGKYYVATGEAENLQDQVQFLFQHFEHKTGEKLYFFKDEDSGLKKIAKPVAKELGIEVIKKMVGF
jgi:hypothetical protein